MTTSFRTTNIHSDGDKKKYWLSHVASQQNLPADFQDGTTYQQIFRTTELTSRFLGLLGYPTTLHPNRTYQQIFRTAQLTSRFLGQQNLPADF